MEIKPFHNPLPVDTRVNQKFGENKACVSLDGKNHVITCNGLKPPRGYKSVYSAVGHKGVDYRAYRGQEVYNSRAGIVEFVDTNPRTGLDVRIVSMVGVQKFRHIYEHLLGYQPSLGDFVPTGALIGWADSTGYSSADHLHFQLEKWENNTWVAIDPQPLLSGKYAKNVLAYNSTLAYALEQLAMALDRLGDYLRNRNLNKNV